jgi:hypothetical protein
MVRNLYNFFSMYKPRGIDAKKTIKRELYSWEGLKVINRE